MGIDILEKTTRQVRALGQNMCSSVTVSSDKVTSNTSQGLCVSLGREGLGMFHQALALEAGAPPLFPGPLGLTAGEAR